MSFIHTEQNFKYACTLKQILAWLLCPWRSHQIQPEKLNSVMLFTDNRGD